MVAMDPPPPPRPTQPVYSGGFRVKQTARKSTSSAYLSAGILLSKRKCMPSHYEKKEKKPYQKPVILKRTYETRSSERRNAEKLDVPEPKIVAPGDKKDNPKNGKK